MKKWLDKTLKDLNLVNDMEQEEGFTRLGYSKEEQKAMAVFVTVAKELGLEVRSDAAGNRIARWNPTEGARSLPAIAMGSHVDTVQNGGGYDGVAGVLCALGAIKHLKEDGFLPSSPLEVICFASEESSRFGISTIGSKAMSGIIKLEELENVTDEKGITIRQAVESVGLRWEDIAKANRPKEEIKKFIELHIEQGVQLEDNNADFGAVESIACPIRLKIKVYGQSGHTGTTPMGKRKDALVAIAPLIPYVSENAERITKEANKNLVATVSTVSLFPNAISVIPDMVEIGIDIRSVKDELKEKLNDLIVEKCQELEKTYNVNIVIETLVNNKSVALDQHTVSELKTAGESAGYRGFTMDSGAGHDVMNMAQKWPSGLIFIPCKDGISHHPKEHASLEDLEMGVAIIVQYLKETAI